MEGQLEGREPAALHPRWGRPELEQHRRVLKEAAGVKGVGEVPTQIEHVRRGLPATAEGQSRPADTVTREALFR